MADATSPKEPEKTAAPAAPPAAEEKVKPATQSAAAPAKTEAPPPSVAPAATPAAAPAAPEAKPTAAGQPVDFTEAGKLDPGKTSVPKEEVQPNNTNLATDAEKLATPEEPKKTEPPAPAAPIAGQPPAPATPIPGAGNQQMAESFGVAQQANTPGTSAELNGPFPAELARWSWGAFFFSWFWSIFNHVWIGLLALLGPLALIVAIVLGVKGNEWAWKNRKFSGVEEFNSVQKKWANWGLALFLISIVGGAAMFFLGIFSISKSLPSTIDSLGTDLNITVEQ